MMSPSVSDSVGGAGKANCVRRPACQHAGSRSHARANVARGVALGAGGRDRGHHPFVHQPAILAALLHRLHAAQHRVFLSPDRADAAVHVPDLSGNRERAARSNSLVRHPAFCRHLRLRHPPDAQRPQGGGSRLGIRRRADDRHRRRRHHVGGADGGVAAHRRLEPAAERAAVYGLSAVRRREMVGTVPRHRNRRSNRRRPITCCRAKACSAFRSRPLPTP